MAKLIVGQNDLATVNPNLAVEWHPSKNGSLLPSQITAGSNKKVWWLGKCGHEWQAVVFSRVKGHGCPYCSNIKVLAGFNDLASRTPDCLNWWDYSKNNMLGILPTAVMPGSKDKVWWHCPEGHVWDQPINSFGIHLPLTDKSHERDGEQQDQRKEKRTRQGRIGVHQIFLSDIIAARQFVHAASLEKRLR